MNLNFNSSNKQGSSILKKFMTQRNTNFDDVLPYDDVKYFDEYEDIILNDDMLREDRIKLKNDFYFHEDVMRFDN